MEYYFFTGEGPDAKKIIEDGSARAATAQKLRDALLADYGAEAMVIQSWTERPIGICFSSEQNSPWLRPCTAYRGEGHAYYGRRSTWEGRQLNDRLLDERLHFSWSAFIVGRTGTYVLRREGRMIYHTVAGVVDGRILLKIPRHSFETGCPDVPEWFREIRESVFLALQGR